MHFKVQRKKPPVLPNRTSKMELYNIEVPIIWLSTSCEVGK